MQGTIRLAVGFLLIAFGVGGVENSMDDVTMLYGCSVSLVGLCVFASGACAAAAQEHRERYRA